MNANSRDGDVMLSKNTKIIKIIYFVADQDPHSHAVNGQKYKDNQVVALKVFYVLIDAR